MKQLFFIFLLSTMGSISLLAQDSDRKERLKINGEIVTALITEDNDTLIIADLDDVTVSSMRRFKSKEEEKRYRKYRYYAVKVYPYAVRAIRIFKETEQVTQTMKRGKRRKHIKRLQKELKEEFEEPLKKLTKTQGLILTKMIEKELNTPMYTLIRNLRGGTTATFWSTMGRFYGYRLKEGYKPGEDPILDAVLTDFDVSHKL
ncbi:MAG: DUF4294 domain-containing protein [Bacteroidota bacterium]